MSDNWKLKFESLGAIMSHQMVVNKEETINNKVQLPCSCCKKERL